MAIAGKVKLLLCCLKEKVFYIIVFELLILRLASSWLLF